MLCLTIPFIVAAAATGRENGHANILMWYSFSMYVLWIVTIVETVSYFVRFLPGRLRAGSALNRTILLDLDRRITDLSSRIDQAAKEKQAEQKQ